VRRSARGVRSGPGLALAVTLAAAAAGCGDDPAGSDGPHPLPAPELDYLGREPSGDPGVPDALWVEMTNFGDYDFALFAEAPDLPPCGENPRAARTWIELHLDETPNHSYCGPFASPPLPDTRMLAVFHDPSDPPPTVITVELWDRATDRRVEANIVVDRELQFP
jgi:hypothetical protein